VGDLKNAILKEKTNGLHGIDAFRLSLWKPSGNFKLPMSPPATLESSLKELKLDRNMGTEKCNRAVLLDPSSIVGDEFKRPLPAHVVHVLVELPQNGGENSNVFPDPPQNNSSLWVIHLQGQTTTQ
jgi:hypothetical protein